jgi:thioredoxin 1
MSPVRLIAVFSIGFVLFFSACGKQESSKQVGSTDGKSESAQITFIELGSVTCIPCKQMQPVMKSIETRYAGQVEVVFHDVWKDKAPAQKYGIKLIPTQVFLDKEGKEIMRHEGFLAEAIIDSLFLAHGLQPLY